MIILRLNTHSGVPAYLQIVQQVKQAMRIGILGEGDQLPTVKEAVTMIAVNPNTVVKAYRELESLGLVEGRAGLGTFVTKSPPSPPPETQAALAKELAAWLAQARQAGLDDEAAEALFQTTLRTNTIRKEHPDAPDHTVQ